jgi:hypothetical protein
MAGIKHGRDGETGLNMERFMRRDLAILALCGGLGACVLVPPPPPPAPPPVAAPIHRPTLQSARLLCNKKFPPEIGSYAAHAKCVNTAVDRYALPAARYPDLVRLQEQVRAQLSSRIDGRSISPQDGAQQMDEVDKAINQAEQERNMAHPTEANEQIARVQAILQGE